MLLNSEPPSRIANTTILSWITIRVVTYSHKSKEPISVVEVFPTNSYNIMAPKYFMHSNLFTVRESYIETCDLKIS